MVILLLGKNGQVGWELQRSLSPLGKLIALDSKSAEWCGDLCLPDQLRTTIRTLKPDVIVNAAAYTAVDKAESEPLLAKLINTDAVKAIAEEAKSIGALFIHYSTDYVFSGEGIDAWREDDETAPINIYGKTKRDGEDAIQKIDGNYFIFRTSWVYAARGNNFTKSMLRLGMEREQLSIINDQFGAPTGAELIADCTVCAIWHSLLTPDIKGIYHLSASGVTTWFDYAQFIFEVARKKGINLNLREVSAITSSEYMTPALRPLNSRLAINKFEKTFNVTMPDWRVGVQRVLSELLD